MSYNNKKPQGFTLIELLIYITLVSGILIAATTFAWNIINSRTKAFAVQEVEQNGRFIMDKITKAAQGAVDINLPSLGQTGSDLNLALEQASLDPIIFRITDGVLYMQQGSAEAIAISSNQIRVSNLEFTNLSTTDGRSKNINVVLTIEHINPENRNEWQFSDSFSTAVELRDR